MNRRVVLMLFLLVSCASVSVRAETASSFAEARRISKSTGKPIVIDFFTSWCAPCKAFEKAATEDSTLLAALEDVVLFTVDAWDSEEGRTLADRYRIRGYPAFVLVDAQGAEWNRWGGYVAPESWIASLRSVMQSPAGVAELQKRYAEAPDVETATQLAQYYERSNNPLEAVSVYDDLLRMQPEEDSTYRWSIFTELARSFEREHHDIERLRAAHDDVLKLELTPRQWAEMAKLLKPVAWQVNDPDWYASLIPPAMNAMKDSEDQYVVWVRQQLEEDEFIYVQKERESALAQRLSEMEPGWENSIRVCMTFGTWCHENRIHMDEAQQALENALGAAKDEQDKMLLALAWSTLADLCATRGQYASALTAVNRAIEYMPGVPELYDAQRRYQDVVGRR